MKPDRRVPSLRHFRLVSRTCCILFAFGAAAHFAFALLPIAESMASQDGIVAEFEARLLSLSAITFAQLLVASFSLGMASRKTCNLPFSGPLAYGALALGILYGIQTAARYFLTLSATELLFAGDTLGASPYIQAVDVSGIIITLGLIACSFLLFYGRELRIDSEEIA